MEYFNTIVDNISAITDSSMQAIVGKNVDIKVKTQPKARVIFSVGAPVGSQNANFEKEVKADADGVATLTYTRNTPDADTIVVYAKNDASIRTAVSKVYWGVKPILTVTADTTTPASSGLVTYTATLLNPVTGEPMKNRDLRVVFAENIGKEGTHATATAVSGYYDYDYDYHYSYGQRLYQDVYGQSYTLPLTTDANGVAKFYVTGSHEAVTPIVFYDSSTFYTNVLYDSSQYLASFAGNNNGKFDARELNAKAPTATFTNSTYTIDCNVTEAGAYATVYTPGNSPTGKLYTITVKDKDGKPAAGRIANIAIKEVLNGYDSRAIILGTKTGATKKHIVGFDTVYGLNQVDLSNSYGKYKTAVNLDSKGQATFEIGASRINTTATPIVWIDGDTPDRYSGKTNGMLDQNLDTIKELPAVTFIEEKVVSADFSETSGEPVPVPGPATFDFVLLNQNDQEYDYSDNLLQGAKITFMVHNTGAYDITLRGSELNSMLENVVLDTSDGWTPVSNSIITVKPGQYRTISGTILEHVGLNVYSIYSGASVEVTAEAELDHINVTDVKYYGPITASATFTKAASVIPVTPDRMYNGTIVSIDRTDSATNCGTITIVQSDNTKVTIPYVLGDSYQKSPKVKYSDTVTQKDYDEAIDFAGSGSAQISLFEEELNEGDSIRVFYKQDKAGNPANRSIFQLVNNEDDNDDVTEGANDVTGGILVDPVVAVNSATNITDMRTAIERHDLGLDLTVYSELNSYNKNLVAQGLLDAMPNTGYADKAAIQAALDATNPIMAQAEADAIAIAKPALMASIVNVGKVETGKTEGTAVGNTIVGSKDILDAAKTAAQAVYDNATSTSAQLISAKTTLDAAIAAYNTSVVTALTGLKDVAITGTATNNSNAVTLAAGENLVATSSKVDVATVEIDNSTKVKVTGVGAGTTTITVTVENAAGNVIKTGTFTVDVQL